MATCLVCATRIDPFLSFGPMPIANGFLTSADFRREGYFDLNLGFCENCATVQLTQLVDRERMFHEEYPFFTSSSARMVAHFGRFAAALRATLSDSAPFVVELGSNDGVMLDAMRNLGVRPLGVEPSGNVADAAIGKGLPTLKAFFDTETATKIVRDHGHADAVIGANVFCHIPYLHSVIEGIAVLLKPDGVVVFEDPYLGDIIRNTAYDQIYDEHAFYFSATAVSRIFDKHGFELVEIESQSVHGGSMRYTLARAGRRSQSGAAAALLKHEQDSGLLRLETYTVFKRNVERSKQELVTLLEDLSRQGERVVGYAATSKSTTVLNYCSIGPDLLEFISDSTVVKQGRFSPGMHIPICATTVFHQDYPDFAVLFGWNHAEEIFRKERDFVRQGGQWITYVPKVQRLAADTERLPEGGYGT